MHRNLARRAWGGVNRRTVPLWMKNDDFAQLFRPYTSDINKPKRGVYARIPLWDMWDGCILYLTRRDDVAPRHLEQLNELPDGCFGHPVLVTKVDIRGFEDGTVHFLPMAAYSRWPVGLHETDPPDCPDFLRGLLFYRGLHDHPLAIQNPTAFEDFLEIAHPERHGNKRQDNLLYLQRQGELRGKMDNKLHHRKKSYVQTKRAFSVEYSALHSYTGWGHPEGFPGSHWDGWRFRLDHDSFRKVMEKLSQYQGIEYKPRPWLMTPFDIWRNFLNHVGVQYPMPTLREERSKIVHIRRMEEIDAQAAQGKYKNRKCQNSSLDFEAKKHAIRRELRGFPLYP